MTRAVPLSEEWISFTLRADGAERVALKAAFDGWRERPLARGEDGTWTCALPRPPDGRHTYVFVVDGAPRPDPANPLRNERPSGPVESILVLGKDDLPLPLHTGPPLVPLRPRGRDEIRALSLNVHSFQERRDRFAKLRRIAEGIALLDVDVAALNEVLSGRIFSRGYQGRRFDTAEEIRRHVEAFTGRSWFLHGKPFGRWEDGEELGNALLSRHPFAATWTGELPTTSFWPAPRSKRNVVGVRLRLPEGAPLLAFATHPMGFEHADTRPQILAIKDFVRRHLDGGDRGALVMGDFNVPDTDEDTGRLLREAAPRFHDAMAHALPGDPAHATSPDRRSRIDYVFVVAGRDEASTTIEARRVFDGEAVEGRILPVVSDHAGVYARLAPAPRP